MSFIDEIFFGCCTSLSLLGASAKTPTSLNSRGPVAENVFLMALESESHPHDFGQFAPDCRPVLGTVFH